jgi:hypothetical protein
MDASALGLLILLDRNKQIEMYLLLLDKLTVVSSLSFIELIGN